MTEKDSKLYAIIRPNLQRIKETGVSNIVETFKWKVVDTYNQSVENYKKIHDFVVTNRELPKTRMGKVKRFELKDFIEEREKPVAKQAVPKFEEYGMLAAMIEELTGAKPQPGDHIEIDLGLDSLSLIELQLMIEKSFGVVFKEGELTNHPTLEKLAETIRDRRTRLESEAMDWAELLNRDIKLKMPRRIWMLSMLHFGMSILLAGRLKVSGKGVENIPDGPCIFAPNHESFLDTLVLVRFLPKAVYRKTFFFAKDKNFKFPFGKTFARNSHVILMDINAIWCSHCRKSPKYCVIRTTW